MGLFVLEKKIFKFFNIYAHGSHVGHVTQLICINFHSYSPYIFFFLGGGGGVAGGSESFLTKDPKLI